MERGLRAHPDRLIAAMVATAAVVTAAGIGNVATLNNIATWYVYLNKPGFTPPNWVFGPAWSVLYVLMIIAFWRILVLAQGLPGRSAAIGWFLGQLVLNAAWSVVFFGLHWPLGGLVVIGLMIVAIAATMVAFFRLDRVAGLVLIPYLGWVCFATALNAGVWLLNR